MNINNINTNNVEKRLEKYRTYAMGRVDIMKAGNSKPVDNIMALPSTINISFILEGITGLDFENPKDLQHYLETHINKNEIYEIAKNVMAVDILIITHSASIQKEHGAFNEVLNDIFK